MRWIRAVGVGFTATLCVVASGCFPPEPVPGNGRTERVSIASDGTQANSLSVTSNISGDGRYVVFDSDASSLVPGDTNSASDVFVRDRQTGTTTRVSVATDGSEGNAGSTRPKISADGRYVSFGSVASHLVAGDTNGVVDVFVHDLQTGTTTRVSVTSGGGQSNAFTFTESAISEDGRYVAFYSSATNLVAGDTNGVNDIFVHDRQTSTTTRESVKSDGTQANGGSSLPAISGDGRYVVFESVATNLVPGDLNGKQDIFIHDRQGGSTSRVNVPVSDFEANGDAHFPTISRDGKVAAYFSEATNIVAGDTNGASDVFVHELTTGNRSRVSVASDGTQGNGASAVPSLSADGRYVAFNSQATNLVTGDTNAASDVFIRDRQTGTTTRDSLDGDEAQGNNSSSTPSISGDGRYFSFTSAASNLVAGDTNGVLDIFARDRFG